MYRKSTTPGRRTTRGVRSNSKRRRSDGRGSGGGLKAQFAQAAERPAKKWVEVLRRPAPKVSFLVKTWVPYSKLTENEIKEYEEKIAREAQRKRQQRIDEAARDTNDEPTLEAANAGQGQALESSPTESAQLDIIDTFMAQAVDSSTGEVDNPTAKRSIDETSTKEQLDILDEPSAKRTRVEGDIGSVPEPTRRVP